MEKITKHGKFWLDNIQNAIPGTIEFLEKKRVKLFVHGELNKTTNDEKTKIIYNELNGTLLDGTQIKIVGISPYPEKIINKENVCVLYDGHTYVEGKNGLFEDNKEYREIRWSLDGYERWIGFRPCLIKEDNGKLYIDIEKDFIDNFKWKTELGMISLIFEEKIVQNALPDSLPSIHILENWELSLRLDNYLSIDQVTKISQIVERFFTTIVSCELIIKNPKIYDKIGNEFQLSFSTYDYEKIEKTVFFISFFAHFRDNFGHILYNYINEYDKYLSGFYSYSTLFVKGGFNETKLSSCISGLEALHTKKYGRSKINKSKDELKKIFKDKLITCTSFNSRERDSILKTYINKYDYSLKDRLTELTLEMNFLEKEKIKKIIDNVVSIRNDLAHYGGFRDVDPLFTVFDIIFLIEIFKMIYVFSIMKIIGVQQETINIIYDQSSYFGRSQICFERYIPKDTSTLKKKGA